MTFLKKLGQIIVSGLGIALGFLPTLQAALPNNAGTLQTVSKDLSELLNIIVSVEATGAALGLAGPDKLHAAAPQIAQVLLQSSALAGKPIANQPLFLQGCTDIASGLAEVLNAVHPDAAQTAPSPAPAA